MGVEKVEAAPETVAKKPEPAPAATTTNTSAITSLKAFPGRLSQMPPSDKTSSTSLASSIKALNLEPLARNVRPAVKRTAPPPEQARQPSPLEKITERQESTPQSQQ